MVPPREQWCIQIEVTNACTRRCSNCTRLLAHASEPFYMSPALFEQAVLALRDFCQNSPISKTAQVKLIGVMGGEPLLHPQFAELVKILSDHVPKVHRGLWTGLCWQDSKHAATIARAFEYCYIHNNKHETPAYHSPVLVASQDVIHEPDYRRAVIDDCWLQQRWSSSVTPKGFFFCEVAAAFDCIFDGPGGLPVEPACWDRPLADFESQIKRWCDRCGVCLNLQGRLDSEEVDDVSPSNLQALDNSPRVLAGEYRLHDSKTARLAKEPWKYLS